MGKLNSSTGHFASRIAATAVAAGLIWTTFSGPLLREPLGGLGIPYAHAVLTNLADLVVMGVLVGLAARAGPRRPFGLVGLAAPILRPVVWAAILFVPAVVVAALAAPVADDFSGLDLFWKGVGFPVFEEVSTAAWRWAR